MPVGVPPGEKLEIEFSTWVDVTADAELLYQGSLTTRFGRTSQFSQPGPGSLTVTLRNELGRYTPGRQVLTDGVTPHPYWPNVLPRRRIRWSYTIAGVTYYRFTGYIKGWPPALMAGVRPYVTITATTRDDQLSRMMLQSPIGQETTQDDPQWWWPLTEAAGSTTAMEQSGNGGPPLGAAGPGAVLTFGDNGPGFGDGPGVLFAAGQYLVGGTTLGIAPRTFTVEFWFNIAAAPGGAQAMVTFDSDVSAGGGGLGAVTIGLNTSRNVTVNCDAGVITSSAVASVNGWHHVALTRDFASSGYVLYLDGVNVGIGTGSFIPGHWETIIVGHGAAGDPPGLFAGNLGQITVYGAVLSTTRVGAHVSAGLGYYGDTTGTRVARYLAYAGLTTADWTLDTGVALVNTYPQDGKSITQGCQDMATTEGGVFWVGTDGKVRFADRRARSSTTPVLTLDASIPALLDPSVYDPAFDETTLVNQSTASRSAESGTLSMQTYTDAVSAAAYGLTTGDVTTYTLSDVDAVNLAQSQVAGNSRPRFRLDQVAVNMHAAPVSLYAALAAVSIGSRIRVINLPPGAAPTSTIDLYVEGWAETVDAATYRVVFDTSPADNPPKMILDDTAYGRLQCDSQTLSTALTLPSTTTVVIATAASKPTFTTASARYPLNIKIGEEVIKLNTPPGGATSPQTFTGVSRGQQGTPAAAQASGAVVNLWPAAGLAL